jgi:transglutaminase-like putative cysteine protease
VIRYEYPVPVTDLRQRLVVLPPERHGSQRLVTSDFAVRGVEGAVWLARTDRWGNTVADVAVPAVATAVEFVVTAVTETDVPGTDGPAPILLDHVSRYLPPTRLTSRHPSGGFSTLVGAAHGADPAHICGLVHRALRYEPGVTGVRTTASEALAAGAGVCQDFAHVMLAVCRAVGLPARYVSGHLAGEGASHAWVETLRPVAVAGRTRFAVEAWDPTHDRPTDERYLTVATGRDYDDVAPMSGTFDAADLVDARLVVTKTLDVDRVAAP